MTTKNTKTKTIRFPKIRLFKPAGAKPQFETLFDEWRATGRKGLPSKWLHPRKNYHWRRWNAMTNGGLMSSEQVIKTEGFAMGRSLIGLGANRPDVKITKKALEKLDDCALFL